VEEFQQQKQSMEGVPEGAAVVNVGQGSPISLTVKVPALHYGDT